MGRKFIEKALIEAKELEEAATNNAIKMVVETFKPDITTLFRDILTEEEDSTEHDIGKEPDAGRDDTDASGDEINEEWEAVKGASGRDVKNIDSEEWEAVHDGEDHDPGKEEIEGEKVANKTTGSTQQKIKPSDPGNAESIEGEQVANKIGGSAQPDPDPQDPGKFEDELFEVYLFEEDSEEDEEESEDREEDSENDAEEYESGVEDSGEESSDSDELEIPDELFDDEEDEVEGEDNEDNVDLVSNYEDEDEESYDDDMESDGEEYEDEYEDDDIGGDEYEVPEDGLYIRTGGEFRKVTLANYLKTRISELTAEKEGLERAVGALQGQLRESNLFNAKLAYVNKLYNSGLFNSAEKHGIAERVDECNTIDEVKILYKNIVEEVKTKNPLDNFSTMIKEARHNATRKIEKMPLYESPEMVRMRKNAGLLKD